MGAGTAGKGSRRWDARIRFEMNWINHRGY